MRRSWYCNAMRAFASVLFLVSLLPAADQQFFELRNFRLDSGQKVASCRLGYRTFGSLNGSRDNAILFPTWFSGQTADLEQFFGSGKLIDTGRFFVIAVDALGNGVSCSPSSAKGAISRFTIGDMVQAEIHTLYGGVEAQVQMSVALDPVDDVLRTCERVARESYEAGVDAVRPGVTFAGVVHAMEAPLLRAGCWGKTPLLHTMSFGATGFTAVNREQLAGTREAVVEGQTTVGIRRGDLVLTAGMVLELEPNACIGMQRVNLGGGVLVTSSGCEELNQLATRVHHRA